jgi:hypothetical protein
VQNQWAGGDINHLMMAKVQIKIAAAKKKFETPRKRFDVQKLQNHEFQQNFQLQLRNKHEQLGSLENEVT